MNSNNNNNFSENFLYKFPEKSELSLKEIVKLFKLLLNLNNQKNMIDLNHIFTYPHPISKMIWKVFLPYNLNSLGNWSIKTNLNVPKYTDLEKELIFRMTDLYKGNCNFIEGYMSSGSTEGNIFSTWVGREYFRNKGSNINSICMLSTSLTHYSIKKAANIAGNIPNFVVPLNHNSWSIDINCLEKLIEKLVNKNKFCSFLLPLTLGYTLTGTSDNYLKVISLIKHLKQKYNKIDFFIWIDAATNGLIKPFVENNFDPLKHSEIKTFLTDFHKFGFVPIPSGIILYKKYLRKLIENNIDYLEQNDNTVLGSRPGIAPIACWAVILKLGKKGFKRIIMKNRKAIKVFIKKNKQVCNDKIKFIYSNDSLGLCLVSEKRNLIMKNLENKYKIKFKNVNILFDTGLKNIYVAKVYFLRMDFDYLKNI